MPKYTATMNRSSATSITTFSRIFSRVIDAEADRKLRDTEFPSGRSLRVDVTIVPWTDEDDAHDPAVDGGRGRGSRATITSPCTSIGQTSNLS
jgi:hypothetical protein